MKVNELIEELENREFGELKKIKLKQKNIKLLQKLEKNGIDIGAVIDLALEKMKLEKIVKELEKNKSQESGFNEQLNNKNF